MPVATVVGGTPNVSTMPPMATGRDATLYDIITCANAMAIMGTQDWFSPMSCDRAVLVMINSFVTRLGEEATIGFLIWRENFCTEIQRQVPFGAGLVC
ncbi:hypothetical protein D3C71_1950040 [compost metagenome]